MNRSLVLLASLTAAAELAALAPAADLNRPPSAAANAVVGGIVSDALTQDGMRHLAVQFPVDDMRRIMKSASYDQNFGPDLDKRIDHVRAAWKNKYGQSFSEQRLEAALSGEFLKIKPSAGGAEMDADLFGGGRHIGLTMERDHGMWAAQVPHSLTAEELRQGLLTQLTAFDRPLAQWPAHETEAYRQVAVHVIAAVTEKPAAVSAAIQPAASPRSAQATASLTHPWWEFWK